MHSIAEQISDEEKLLRAIHPDHIKPGGFISSGTFKSRSNPHVSVDREKLSRPRDTLSRNQNAKGVARLIASEVRSLDLSITPDPLPENPSHALIIQNENQQISKSIAKKLAQMCEWAIPPIE